MPGPKAEVGTEEPEAPVDDGTVVEKEVPAVEVPDATVIPEVPEEPEVEHPEPEEGEDSVARLQQLLVDQKTEYEKRIGKLATANDDRQKTTTERYEDYVRKLKDWQRGTLSSMQNYYENLLEEELPPERLAEHYKTLRRTSAAARQQSPPQTQPQEAPVAQRQPQLETAPEPEEHSSDDVTSLKEQVAELTATVKNLTAPPPEPPAEPKPPPGKGARVSSGSGRPASKQTSRDQEIADVEEALAEAKKRRQMAEALKLKSRLALLQASKR